MKVITAFVLFSFVAAPVPKADPAQEAKQSFQGHWTVVELISEGTPENPEELAKTTFFVIDDRWEVNHQGHDERIVFRLNPMANPHTIDLTIINDDEKPVPLTGIYKQEKNRIIICFSLNGQERPKEFKSADGSNTGLLVLERVKK